MSWHIWAHSSSELIDKSLSVCFCKISLFRRVSSLFLAFSCRQHGGEYWHQHWKWYVPSWILEDCRRGMQGRKQRWNFPSSLWACYLQVAWRCLGKATYIWLWKDDPSLQCFRILVEAAWRPPPWLQLLYFPLDHVNWFCLVLAGRIFLGLFCFFLVYMKCSCNRPSKCSPCCSTENICKLQQYLLKQGNALGSSVREGGCWTVLFFRYVYEGLKEQSRVEFWGKVPFFLFLF